MTPDQIELVQTSFNKVAPAADEAGMLFYRRLFEIAPETRMLFADDISEQSGKLMTIQHRLHPGHILEQGTGYGLPVRAAQ